METLRERKKQRTRDALLRAAVELFTSQGYDGTTVDEIAAAVDVSQRTFFRYFAGKDEAALALVEMTVERFVEAVRARPRTSRRSRRCARRYWTAGTRSTRSSSPSYPWSCICACTG